MATSKDEARVRGTLQHSGDRFQQFPQPFTLHEAAGVQDQGRAMASRSMHSRARLGTVINAIAYDPYPVVRRRTVGGDQVAFAAA